MNRINTGSWKSRKMCGNGVGGIEVVLTSSVAVDPGEKVVLVLRGANVVSGCFYCTEVLPNPANRNKITYDLGFVSTGKFNAPKSLSGKKSEIYRAHGN